MTSTINILQSQLEAALAERHQLRRDCANFRARLAYLGDIKLRDSAIAATQHTLRSPISGSWVCAAA